MYSKSARNFFVFGAMMVSVFFAYIMTSSRDVVASTAQPAANAEQPAPSPLMPPRFIEGSHYITKFPQSTRAKGPVVVEFFSYMCPHCYRLEGSIKRWLKEKPADIEFHKIPVAFEGNAMYGLAARAHYIAEELGVMEQFGDAMFKRIHLDRRPPRSDRDLARLFSELGVSEADFKKAAENNFNVESKLRRAKFLTQQYQVTGVPYLLINYKYEVGKDSYESERSLFDLWSNLPYKDFK